MDNNRPAAQVVEAIIEDDGVMIGELNRSSDQATLRAMLKAATDAAVLLRRQISPTDPVVPRMVLARLLPKDGEEPNDPSTALNHAMRKPNERVPSRGDES